MNNEFENSGSLKRKELGVGPDGAMVKMSQYDTMVTMVTIQYKMVTMVAMLQ